MRSPEKQWLACWTRARSASQRGASAGEGIALRGRREAACSVLALWPRRVKFMRVAATVSVDFAKLARVCVCSLPVRLLVYVGEAGGVGEG